MACNTAFELAKVPIPRLNRDWIADEENVVSALKDLRRFEGRNGALVADRKHIWMTRTDEGAAHRLMIAQIKNLSVSEHENPRSYSVRLNVRGPVPSKKSVPHTATIRLEYGAYQRLTTWAETIGIPVVNPAREARLGKERRNSEPRDAEQAPHRPHRSKRSVVDCLDRLVGVATVDELIAGTSGGRGPLNSRTTATEEVLEAVRGLSTVVQVHDHAVVVKWSSAKGKSGHRPIVAALQAIASRDEVSGRDKLELDEYALELCIGGARTRALLDVLGFADSPTPDDESAVGADADERSFAMAAAATKISVSAAGSAVAAEPVHEKSSDTSGVMRLAREWPAVVGSIVRATLKVGDRRASAVCDTSTGRLTITTGVLAGRRFLDPTSAAIAVVAETGLDVPFPRDGWSEWKVNGRPIADLVAEAID